MMPAILGLDPSLRATGLALPDGELVTIKTPSCATLDDKVERVRHIVGRVGVAAKIAALIVIEGPAFGRNNQATHELAGLWWKLVVRLAEQGNQVAVLTPTQLKKFATGRGDADKGDPKKTQMRQAFRQHAGRDVADHNQVDAWWLRMAGLVHLGHPDALSLPAVQRDALAKVAWPEGLIS